MIDDLDIDASCDDLCFDEIADTLLNHCCLKINNEKYRLIEIEFYLYNDTHKDKYVHRDRDQLKKNRFYFHKFKTGTYKAGTFKGLDITFGDKHTKSYFGILIRSVQHIKTSTITEGPCNCVNLILAAYDCDSIMTFTQGKNLDIYENDHDFVIIEKDLEQLPLARGPRIGLKPHWPEFHAKHYRYATNHTKIKKLKTQLKLFQ